MSSEVPHEPPVRSQLAKLGFHQAFPGVDGIAEYLRWQFMWDKILWAGGRPARLMRPPMRGHYGAPFLRHERIDPMGTRIVGPMHQEGTGDPTVRKANSGIAVELCRFLTRENVFYSFGG